MGPDVIAMTDQGPDTPADSVGIAPAVAPVGEKRPQKVLRHRLVVDGVNVQREEKVPGVVVTDVPAHEREGGQPIRVAPDEREETPVLAVLPPRHGEEHDAVQAPLGDAEVERRHSHGPSVGAAFPPDRKHSPKLTIAEVAMDDVAEPVESAVGKRPRQRDQHAISPVRGLASPEEKGKNPSVALLALAQEAGQGPENVDGEFVLAPALEAESRPENLDLEFVLIVVVHEERPERHILRHQGRCAEGQQPKREDQDMPAHSLRRRAARNQPERRGGDVQVLRGWGVPLIDCISSRGVG